MYVFVSLPAPTQMSEQHCLEKKNTEFIKRKQKTQTLD